MKDAKKTALELAQQIEDTEQPWPQIDNSVLVSRLAHEVVRLHEDIPLVQRRIDAVIEAQDTGNCVNCSAPLGVMGCDSCNAVLCACCIAGHECEEQEETCTIIQDGDTEMRVRHSGELSEETNEALREVCKAAYKRLIEKNPHIPSRPLFAGYNFPASVCGDREVIKLTLKETEEFLDDLYNEIGRLSEELDERQPYRKWWQQALGEIGLLRRERDEARAELDVLRGSNEGTRLPTACENALGEEVDRLRFEFQVLARAVDELAPTPGVACAVIAKARRELEKEDPESNFAWGVNVAGVKPEDCPDCQESMREGGTLCRRHLGLPRLRGV